jgi:hypothetical protein
VVTPGCNGCSIRRGRTAIPSPAATIACVIELLAPPPFELG